MEGTIGAGGVAVALTCVWECEATSRSAGVAGATAASVWARERDIAPSTASVSYRPLSAS